MSFSFKEFFGLTPMDPMNDDAQAYYDEPRYADDGSAAYQPAPRRDYDTNYSRHEASAPMPHFEPSIVTTEPRSYADAVKVGEPFRDGDAVVFELTDMDPKMAKRIIDFAAGLCFASRGTMHKLSEGLETRRKVFAVVPEHMFISVSELQRAAGLR